MIIQLKEYKTFLITAAIAIIFTFALIYFVLLPELSHKPQTIIKYKIIQTNEDECISTPCGKSVNSPGMIILGVSNDKTYGYTQENPIKVGGYSEKDGPDNERRYLNSIYGPNGEIIGYTREGSCCSFRTLNGMEGFGLLDRFKISYEGLKEPVILYLNMYDHELPKVPFGFTVKTEIKVIQKNLIFNFVDRGK